VTQLKNLGKRFNAYILQIILKLCNKRAADILPTSNKTDVFRDVISFNAKI